MKSITATDIYRRFESTYQINAHLKSVIGGSGTRITTELASDILAMERSYKDILTVKACKALTNGDIILVYGDPSQMLPPFMPFVKTIKNNREVVICDLSMTSFMMRQNKNTGETSYSMDIRQLNSIVVSAYIFLNLRPNSIIPPDITKNMAMSWARMFCKVLNQFMGLNTNPDRYNAFMYFAMKYFMIYILEIKEASADMYVSQMSKDGKSSFVRQMEEAIAARDLHPYNSFEDFCNTLFDHDISSISSARTMGDLNMASYLKVFTRVYGLNSVFSLAAFPYFMYVYISVNNANRGFNRRVFEDVMVNPRTYTKCMKDFTSLVE